MKRHGETQGVSGNEFRNTYPGQVPAMVSREVAAFLESGVSLLVGTRDSRLVPEAIRAFGARVESGAEEATVFLPVAPAARTLANLRENSRIAVCFSRPGDHRSVQLKGGVVSIREADETDRTAIDRYRQLLSEALRAVGVPPRLSRRFAHWPAMAVRFRVQAVFVQTPGPGAGAPLTAAQGGERATS